MFIIHNDCIHAFLIFSVPLDFGYLIESANLSSFDWGIEINHIRSYYLEVVSSSCRCIIFLLLFSFLPLLKCRPYQMYSFNFLDFGASLVSLSLSIP